jgi:dihydroorotate dehydrogenase
MKPDLSVEIAGIKMKNLVMNCSGTCDVTVPGTAELYKIDKIGAYVHKTNTLKPRDGFGK